MRQSRNRNRAERYPDMRAMRAPSISPGSTTSKTLSHPEPAFFAGRRASALCWLRRHPRAECIDPFGRLKASSSLRSGGQRFTDSFQAAIAKPKQGGDIPILSEVKGTAHGAFYLLLSPDRREFRNLRFQSVNFSLLLLHGFDQHRYQPGVVHALDLVGFRIMSDYFRNHSIHVFGYNANFVPAVTL